MKIPADARGTETVDARRDQAPAPAQVRRTPQSIAASLQRSIGNRALTAALQRDCACGTCAACRADADRERSAGRILEGRGAGTGMPAELQRSMEDGFGHDFSDVRIHTDTHATRTAAQVDAAAYTVGRDIFFGNGHYRPETGEGQRLLAHELTHVVQQGGRDVPTGTELQVTSAGDQYEQEADRVADSIVAGGGAGASTATASPLGQRSVLQRGAAPSKGQKPTAGDAKGAESKPGAAADKASVKLVKFKMPTGVLVPQIHYNAARKEYELRTDFWVVGRFEPANGATDCSGGEYRQWVRGLHRINNQYGFPGSKADRQKRRDEAFTTWVEDIDDRSGIERKYGHRKPDTKSDFFMTADGTEDRATGCNFMCGDRPIVSGPPGCTLYTNIEFKGQFIDTKTGAILAEQTWRVLSGEAGIKTATTPPVAATGTSAGAASEARQSGSTTQAGGSEQGDRKSDGGAA